MNPTTHKRSVPFPTGGGTPVYAVEVVDAQGCRECQGRVIHLGDGVLQLLLDDGRTIVGGASRVILRPTKETRHATNAGE
ncbi:MAG: hypothetical protein AAGF92_14675 [Myxococcota bacterium]